MTTLAYSTLHARTLAQLDVLVAAAIANDQQPYGDQFYDEGVGEHCQVVTTSTGVTGSGSVPTAVADYAVATETGNSIVHQTLITLDNLPQTVVNGTEYQGTKIYDFPAGRIFVLGCTATLQQKTTSVIADTLNSGTGAISLGTATASATTLASTMVDLLPSTAFTSSATINVAGTAVTAQLVAGAQFDGTASAKDAYLNTAYATTGDVDADATQTISGAIRLTWVQLGDV